MRASAARFKTPIAVIVDSSAQALLRHRVSVLRAMAAVCDRVVALAPADHAYAGLTEAELLDGFRSAGVEFVSIPFDRLGTNPARDLVSLAAIAVQVRRRRPDLVVSFTPKGIILGSAAAAIGAVPRKYAVLPGLGYLFSMRVSDRPLLKRVSHTVLRLALRLNRTVIVQNPDDARLLVAEGYVSEPERCVVVNGAGVDPLLFTYSSPPTGECSFLFMSRMYPEKGAREFVAAARRLRGRWPRAKFLMLGSFDSSGASLRPEEVAAWEEEGCITYLGHLSDVRPALSACSVLVLPSYYQEGIPNCLIEAMMTGRPVITTDWPGCREPVTAGVTGLLVPPKDPVSLAAAMEHFLENPDQIVSMGSAARTAAQERFSTHVVVGQMLKAMEL